MGEDLQNWWPQVATTENFPKRNILIHLQDPITNQPLATWYLINCWTKTWKVNGFDGKGSDWPIEELLFVVEDIRIGN